MRIPSGDLAPARRSRRRGRALPAVLALVVLAALGGGAYALFLREDEPAPAADTLAVACPPPAAPAATVAAPERLPEPSAVRFVLLNGTDRNGLGKRTGDALAARSFVVTRTGNPPSPLSGPSRVYYGPGALPAAALLVAQVEGAQLVARPRAARGRLELVLGSGFQRLNTPAQAAAALAGPLPVPTPKTPAPAPRPAGCP